MGRSNFKVLTVLTLAPCRKHNSQSLDLIEQDDDDNNLSVLWGGNVTERLTSGSLVALVRCLESMMGIIVMQRAAM